MGDFLVCRLLPGLLNMTLTASVAILLVLAARLALRRAPRTLSYALWLVVLFRMLCPVSLSVERAPLALLDVPVVETNGYVSAVTYLPGEMFRTPDSTEQTSPPAEETVSTGAPAQGTQTGAGRAAIRPAAVAAWIWLTGAAAMALYSLLSLLRLRRRLVGATPLGRGVYLADHIDTPFVLGLARPRIYLPSALPERERGYILLHERHHIRRLDHVVKLLAFLALCLHWFNPLAWLFFALLGRDMEMSCDEAVMQRLGETVRADYSASLLRLSTGRRIIAGAPLAFGEGSTVERVKNILRWRRPRLWAVLLGALLCAVVITACAVNPRETADTDGDPAPETVTFSNASVFETREIPLPEHIALAEGEQLAVLDASGARVLAATYFDDPSDSREQGYSSRSGRLLICDWERETLLLECALSSEQSAVLCTDGVLADEGAVCTVVTGMGGADFSASLVRFGSDGSQTPLFTCLTPEVSYCVPEILSLDDGGILFSYYDEAGGSFGVQAVCEGSEPRPVYLSRRLEDFIGTELRGNGREFLYYARVDGQNSMILGDSASVRTVFPLGEERSMHAFGLTEEHIAVSLADHAQGRENYVCLFDFAGELLLEVRYGPYFQFIFDCDSGFFVTDMNYNAAIMTFPEEDGCLTLKKTAVELPHDAALFYPLSPNICLIASGGGTPQIFLMAARA